MADSQNSETGLNADGAKRRVPTVETNMATQITKTMNPEIQQALTGLKRQIQRYVVLEGVAMVAVVLGCLFWFSLAVDAAYFQLSRLDLPVWFRMLFQITTVSLLAACCMSYIVLRLLKQLRGKALALVLERRFPELDDRLITAVELDSLNVKQQSDLTIAMTNRTVTDVAEVVEKLDVGAVFDRVPLRRAAIGAVVLVTSLIVFGATNAAAMERWARAYIALDASYWERQTALVVRAVAQPGDVVRDFAEFDDRFEYKHPRGTELTLMIDVPDSNKPDGTDWVVPERVQVDVRQVDGNGNSAQLTSRPFRYSISQVQQDLVIWIRGGDFVNRKPYRIKVVDQPRIDQMTLDCRYPAYTNLNALAGDSEKPATKEVQGLETALPMETQFRFNATTNKELVRVRIQTQPEIFEIDLDLDGATLTLIPEDGPRRQLELPDELGPALISGDRRSFWLPMAVAMHAQRNLADLDERLRYIPVPPDISLRIYLEDEDQITSLEPSRLTIRGIVDQPPQFEDLALSGVGRSITRLAVVPIAGLVVDDYGIEKVRFEYRLDEDQEWKPRPFHNAPRRQPVEFRLERSAREPFERFEVLPMDLAVVQKLTLTVFAEDGDNLNGPHRSRSERFVFKIVSNEELLSLLYEREINLRRRFEQIIQEVKDKRDDLVKHRELYQEGQALLKADEPNQNQKRIDVIHNQVVVCAERSLHDIPKNHNETIAIEESFREILKELVNNGVHKTQMVERLGELIVTPLHQITEKDFPTVNAAVYLFKAANDKNQDPTSKIDLSINEINTMLVHMERVLAEIKDLAEFHETLRDLKQIIDLQKGLAEETKSEQKRKFIERLQKLNELE
jgi:hypothetical protein